MAAPRIEKQRQDISLKFAVSYGFSQLVRAEAGKRNISMAELVRRSVRGYTQQDERE